MKSAAGSARGEQPKPAIKKKDVTKQHSEFPPSDQEALRTSERAEGESLFSSDRWEGAVLFVTYLWGKPQPA